MFITFLCVLVFTDVSYRILGDIDGLKFIVLTLAMTVATMCTIQIRESARRRKEELKETKTETNKE
jgi:hypothetical protein